MTSTMTSTMSEEDIQRTINMCSGLVALTREDLINPPRIPTSDELEENFISSINYVTRSPTYETERIRNSTQYIPGKKSEEYTQKKIVKKYRKIEN